MKAAVIGLGPTYKFCNPDDYDITITVNDGQRNYKTDYVVCVDFKHRFDPDRLKYIEGAECKGFYSQFREWDNIKNFKHIRLQRGSDLDGPNYDSSTNSTYVACVLAYKLGAKQIVTWGVDFTDTHKFFKHKHNRDNAVREFKTLADRMKKKEVTLYVGNRFSRLYEVLPLWKDQKRKHKKY